MTDDEKALQMLSRIDERTKSMSKDIEGLGEQHKDLGRKLSENTAELHRKIEETCVSKETFAESQKTTDAKMTGHGRWMKYISGVLMMVAAAATGAWFRQ